MNTKLMQASIVTTLVLFLTSACGVIPTFGSRNIISENRTVSGFTQLEVSGAGDVTILQDGTEALTIATDDNVMQYVTSKVEGGTLSIGLDFPSLQAVIPSQLKVTLHVKDLSSIGTSGSWSAVSQAIQTADLKLATSGSAKISIDSLTVDSLNADISGSGEMNLAGRAKSQQVTISGSGNYNAGGLQTQDTRVEVSGSGHVTTWATGSLDASVSGMGNIDYYGSPKVTFNQSGSGSIKSLGNK